MSGQMVTVLLFCSSLLLTENIFRKLCVGYHSGGRTSIKKGKRGVKDRHEDTGVSRAMYFSVLTLLASMLN